MSTYIAKDAAEIKNGKKAIEANRQVIYMTVQARRKYDNPIYSDKVTFKIGKGSTNENGILTREDATNQHSSVECAHVVHVLADGTSESEALKIENEIRDRLRSREDCISIPNAKEINSSGNEWTAWDPQTKSNELDEIMKEFRLVVEDVIRHVLGNEAVNVQLLSFEACKNSMQNDIARELYEMLLKVFQGSESNKNCLIQLPTGTGKEPLTLELLLKIDRKLAETKDQPICVLFIRPSPQNDIISERDKWKELNDYISVLERDGKELILRRKASVHERVILVVVTLPALKCKSKQKDAAGNDHDRFEEWDSNNGKNDESNAIEALTKFSKNHGSFDFIVKDESHYGYDTFISSRIYKKLRDKKIIRNSTITIRKSATDFRGLRNIDQERIVTRTDHQLREQMVEKNHWPKLSIVHSLPAVREKLKELGYSEKQIEDSCVSSNPRDWPPIMICSVLESLLHVTKSSKIAWSPSASNETIQKLYHGNSGVFLVLVKQLKDVDAILKAYSSSMEDCTFENGRVSRCNVGNQQVSFINVSGSDRSCKSESDLNKMIKHEKKAGRHVFILTCGAFCQGNNIPELDACVLLGEMKSHSNLIQFMGRLNRSRGIEGDQKFFVVLSEAAGSHLRLALQIPEMIHRASKEGTGSEEEIVIDNFKYILPVFYNDGEWKVENVEDKLTDSVELLRSDAKERNVRSVLNNPIDEEKIRIDFRIGTDSGKIIDVNYDNLGVESKDKSDLTKKKNGSHSGSHDKEPAVEISIEQKRIERWRGIMDQVLRILVIASMQGENVPKTLQSSVDFIDDKFEYFSDLKNPNDVDNKQKYLENKTEVIAAMKYADAVYFARFLETNCAMF